MIQSDQPSQFAARTVRGDVSATATTDSRKCRRERIKANYFPAPMGASR
ncbi:MAG: hypothetical protein WCJ76_05425 [Comamonadaceae bacterium]